jgi:hypothetical protein
MTYRRQQKIPTAARQEVGLAGLVRSRLPCC